jgi:hypothetical protein
VVATLAELVSPLSEDGFAELLRSRSLLAQPAAGLDGRYSDLMRWDEFMEAAFKGELPRDALKVTKRGATVPPVFYRAKDEIRRDPIASIMSAGGHMIAYGIEKTFPHLAALCSNCEDRTGDRVLAGVIASTGEGGALKTHFDHEDIVVLQIEGQKEWVIEDNPVTNPLAGMSPVQAPSNTKVALQTTLAPGDWLFVPAGFRHHCRTIGPKSLHLLVLFVPLSLPYVLRYIADSFMEDPARRAAIRFNNRYDAADIGERIKRELIESMESLSIEDILRRHLAHRSYQI